MFFKAGLSFFAWGCGELKEQEQMSPSTGFSLKVYFTKNEIAECYFVGNIGFWKVVFSCIIILLCLYYILNSHVIKA